MSFVIVSDKGRANLTAESHDDAFHKAFGSRSIALRVVDGPEVFYQTSEGYEVSVLAKW